MRGKSNIDRILAVLADAQWGVVARRQLLAAGVSADQVDRLLRAGRTACGGGHGPRRHPGHHAARTLLNLAATFPSRAFERDAVLAAHDIRTLRFTARQVTDRPAEVVDAVRAAQLL